MYGDLNAFSGLSIDKVQPEAYCMRKNKKGERSMDRETRRRKARFFRLRIILSPALVIVGVVILYCGYQGLVRLSVSAMIAGVALMLAGLCLQLTLAVCPFCGARVNLHSGLLLWNYTCPHCRTNMADGSVSLRAASRKAASPAAFRRKIRLILLGLALGILVLLAAPLLGGSPVALVVGAALLISSLAAAWTIRCPQCGAWIAKQANILDFRRFSCSHCGFSADGAEPEEKIP